MIFNKEKILYWAHEKGEFQVKFNEKSRNTDCYNISRLLLNNGMIELKREARKAWYYSITKKGIDELTSLQAQYKKRKDAKNNKSNSTTKNLDSFLDEDDKGNDGRNYYVYQGLDKKSKEIVYIGTTVQEPSARFRWHKSNGKDLCFSVIHEFSNPDDMLNKEYELILSIKPRLNKITHRKQNLNVKLTKQQLNDRVGDDEWCQICLKRRAKNGKLCGYC